MDNDLTKPLTPPSEATYDPAPARQSLFSRAKAPLPLVPLEHDDPDKQPPKEIATRGAIAKAIRESRYTLDDLHPYRLIVTWRITRWLATHRGLLYTEDTLAEGLASPSPDIPDPWTTPTALRNKPPGALPTSVYSLRTLLLKDDTPPLALVPPVPAASVNPANDHATHCFIHMVTIAAEGLNLLDGSKADPDLGRYGLFGLLEPQLLAAAWPSPRQIAEYEHLILERVIELIVKDSYQHARKEVRDKFGLLPNEIKQVMAMARALASEMTEGSIDEARAIMLLRLEDYIKRAREACQMREEMNAMKQLSIIQGLAEADKDNIDDDFRKIVENTANQRKQITREHPTITQQSTSDSSSD